MHNHGPCIAIVLAAGKENSLTLQILLEQDNINIDKHSGSGYTATYSAVMSNRPENLELLLKKDANCHIIFAGDSNYPHSPLHAACANDHSEYAKLLLENNAEKECYLRGYTPLLIAAEKKSWRCTSLLLQNNADISKITDEGLNALHLSAAYGNYESFKLLVDAGTDKNKPCNSGETPVIVATALDHDSCLQLLLEAGANPNVVGGFKSAVHVAVQLMNSRCLELLMKADADLDVLSDSWDNHLGTTPLMHAVNINSIICVKLLVNAGADLEAGNDGTPLYQACKKGNPRLVAMLLKGEADKEYVHPTTGLTSADVARLYKHEGIT